MHEAKYILFIQYVPKDMLKFLIFIKLFGNGVDTQQILFLLFSVLYIGLIILGLVLHKNTV